MIRNYAYIARKSGTEIALNYAINQGKKIINVLY